MDVEHFSSDISTALQEFKNLHSAHEENKKGHKELSELLSLLQEELRLAKDAEKAAEFNKSKCQVYVSQQQEVILKLLSVKEENKSLKQTIHQMETTLTDIQNNSMAEQVKKYAEIQEIKEDYLKELMKVQEAADNQAMKVRVELNSTLEELRSTLTKNQDIIENQEKTINLLRTEIEDLKERASINVEIYQKKLAEQEREYQAELETWKMAELNRITFEKQAQSTNLLTQYGLRHGLGNNASQHGKLYGQISEYSPNVSTLNTSNNPLNSYSNPINSYNPQLPAQPQILKNQPFVSRSRNISRILPNTVRPLTTPVNKNFQSNNDFLSANEFYLQNQDKLESGNKDEVKESVQLVSNSNEETMSIQKQTIQAPKRRKLLNTNEIFL